VAELSSKAYFHGRIFPAGKFSEARKGAQVLSSKSHLNAHNFYLYGNLDLRHTLTLFPCLVHGCLEAWMGHRGILFSYVVCSCQPRCPLRPVFLFLPPGVNLVPRGELCPPGLIFVPQGWTLSPRGKLCPLRVKLSPMGELCPLRVKLSPRGKLCPLRVKLSPRGEDPLFAPSFV
jgi:hypothetical protein